MTESIQDTSSRIHSFADSGRRNKKRVCDETCPPNLSVGSVDFRLLLGRTNKSPSDLKYSIISVFLVSNSPKERRKFYYLTSIDRNKCSNWNSGDSFRPYKLPESTKFLRYPDPNSGFPWIKHNHQGGNIDKLLLGENWDIWFFGKCILVSAILLKILFHDRKYFVQSTNLLLSWQSYVRSVFEGQLPQTERKRLDRAQGQKGSWDRERFLIS